MMRLCLTLTVALTLFVPCAFAAESGDDGWKSLFDGKSFGDWKPNERPENWTIEDGAIVGHGERIQLGMVDGLIACGVCHLGTNLYGSGVGPG